MANVNTVDPWTPQVTPQSAPSGDIQANPDLSEFMAWLVNNYGPEYANMVINAYLGISGVKEVGNMNYTRFTQEKASGYKTSKPPAIPSAPPPAANTPFSQDTGAPVEPNVPVTTDTTATPTVSTAGGTVVYRYSDGSYIIKLPDGSYVIKDAMGGSDIPADADYVKSLISGDESVPSNAPVRYEEKVTPEGNTIITWYDKDGNITDTSTIAGKGKQFGPGYGPPATAVDRAGGTVFWDQQSMKYYNAQGYEMTQQDALNAIEAYNKKSGSTTPAKSMPTMPAPAGYHWELNQDTGEWYPAIGAPDTGQMSDYQKQQTALQRQQLELQRQQMIADWATSARNAAIQWMATLAQLKAHPGDWIEAYMFEHGYSDESQQILDILKPPAWLTAPTAGVTEISGPPSQNLTVTGGANAWLPNLKTGGPATPPTPNWLPEYAPGQVAGKPITQGNTILPSGQLWNKTPSTKREMLGGYLDYAQGRYPTLTDLTEAIAANLPNKVSTSQWRPAIQR